MKRKGDREFIIELLDWDRNVYHLRDDCFMTPPTETERSRRFMAGPSNAGSRLPRRRLQRDRA